MSVRNSNDQRSNFEPIGTRTRGYYKESLNESNINAGPKKGKTSRKRGRPGKKSQQQRGETQKQDNSNVDETKKGKASSGKRKSDTDGETTKPQQEYDGKKGTTTSGRKRRKTTGTTTEETRKRKRSPTARRGRRGTVGQKRTFSLINSEHPQARPALLKSLEYREYPERERISKKFKPTKVLEQEASLHPNYNKDITDILFEVAKIRKNQGEVYKYQMYLTACESLAAYPKRVESGEKALQLDGIGFKMSRKIQEILDTGHLKQLDDFLNDPDIQALNELCSVYGIGSSSARKFLAGNIRTVEQLREHYEGLNHKQQIGLKYFDEFNKEIPRKEIEKHIKFIINVIKTINPKMIVECVGSYRRGEKKSKDLDFMLTLPEYKKQNDEYSASILNNISNKLTEKQYLTDVVAQGSHQIIGVVNLGNSPYRKFEIKFYPMECFYTGLLHFTGSSDFNRQMRRIAKQRGYKLSEYYLAPRYSLIMNRKNSRDYKLGKPLTIQSEKDIFNALGLPYRKPEERSI